MLAVMACAGCDDDPETGTPQGDTGDTSTSGATSGATDTNGTSGPTTDAPTEDADAATSGATDPDATTSSGADADGTTSGATDAPTDAPTDTDTDVILSPNGDSATWGGDTATVTVTDRDTLTRSYRLTTTAALRDNDPASKQINISELAGQPVLRSGHDLFDALFALAVDEVRQNSVSSISDGAFNNGQGVACPCFETGAKWNYVWTRDTAYAADLGLALLDPTRTQASLAFKLSARKDGSGGPQIVQDTGSGGSYPVSTDRVVWAIGARRTLLHLDGPARDAFASQTYAALVNTLAQDRAVAFDPADGLYRGEQSFLDWREQSYPSWTAQDTVHLGMSKSLSTNVGHYAALRLAADLAQSQGLTAAAAQYTQDAAALRDAIRAHFWLDGPQLFSALKTTTLDPAPLHRYDLLGLTLAILEGVATPAEATASLSAYPFTAAGPPVIWPQQPMIPIYHNRGIWPFVTAYTALAARHAAHAPAFDAALMSLVRGAALNLSNMENFEFTTLAPWYDDGPYSGPVVNSRRQLWSVAGYVGAVAQGLFGVEATDDGLRVHPFLTQATRRTWLRHTDAATLHSLSLRGHTVTVTLRLPPLDDAAPPAGAYAIAGVTLNGQPLTIGQDIPASSLQAGENVVEVTFAAQPDAAQPLTVVTDTSDFRNLWSPREPTLHSVAPDNGRLRLSFDASGEEGVVFHVFRDGVQVASGLTDTSWIDPDSADFSERTYCYAVEAEFPSSGTRSHHSPPRCYWQANDARVQVIDTFALRATPDKPWSTAHGRPHYSGWGAPDDALEVAYLQPSFSGPHLLQVEYGNGSGSINTGITAALKRVEVTRRRDGVEVASGYVLMPQLGSNNWARWADSSLVPLTLDAAEVYRVTLRDAPNMSYFEHFRPYTGGNGGGAGVYNNANITRLKLLSLSGPARAVAAPRVSFDGADDVAKLDAAQRVAVVGAPSQPWSQFGLDWDAEALYVAVVSQAFADPFKPVMIYLEAADTLGAPTPAQGIAYSDQTPQLPFTPTHLISARRTSDSGSADGPWNGVWVAEGGQLTRALRLAPNAGWWVAADNHTLSLRIPRAVLDGATKLRLVAHVVNAAPANEWKDTLPPTHTPWAAGGGGYYEIDLSGPHPVADWVSP